MCNRLLKGSTGMGRPYKEPDGNFGGNLLLDRPTRKSAYLVAGSLRSFPQATKGFDPEEVELSSSWFPPKFPSGY